MKNILKIDGYKAVVIYDPETDQFRGEFIALAGGADFYGTTIDEVKNKGRKSGILHFPLYTS